MDQQMERQVIAKAVSNLERIVVEADTPFRGAKVGGVPRIARRCLFFRGPCW